MKRILTGLVILLLAVLLLGQLKPANKTENTAVLRIGTTMPQDVFSIDSQEGAFGRMGYNAFVQAKFVDLDENLALQPDFMSKWEVKDNREIIFTYPTNARWHDGLPVTGEDLLFTFDLLKRKQAMSSRFIDSVELLAGNRLRIVLNRPVAYGFLREFATYLQVYPKHIWDKVDNTVQYNGQDAVIGCGPYRFVRYDETARVSYYEAAPDYFRGKVFVPNVELHSFATQEALLAALKSGQVDAVYDYSAPIRPTLIGWLQGTDNINLGESSNTGNYMLTYGFNSNNTSRLVLRQAITNALDYALMAQTIAGPYGEIAGRGLISPGNTGFDPQIPRLNQDIPLAREALAQAGYVDIDQDGYRENPDGEQIDLLITPGYVNSKREINLRLAEIISRNLQTVGLRSHIDYVAARNKSAWQGRIRERQDYEIYVGYNTPGVAQFHTAAFYMMPPQFGFHWGTCPDEEYAAAFVALVESADEAGYSKAVKKLQRIHAELLPGVSLCWEKVFYPYRTDKFEGWINYPSWGVINNKTWLNIRTKGRDNHQGLLPGSYFSGDETDRNTASLWG